MCWRTIVVLLLIACRARAAESAGTAPLAPGELRTTEAGIAVGNLNAQIEGAEHLGAAQSAELVELLVVRGQYLGRVGDYERADALAEELVRNHPDAPTSYLARARTRSTLHRFADATADLDEAARRHGPGLAIETMRAGILQAVGRYDEALAIRRRQAAAAPGILTIGAEASALAERGAVADAERRFIAAQNSYRDVSPFPLCWLYTQQGMMWLHAGDLERAREFFAAAHERLPQYPTAAVQLAWLEAAGGNGDSAVRILRDTAASSDDPYAAGVLAKVLQYAGETSEAERWRERARFRYEELLRTHPEAYGHHAAEFWLDAGGDPTRALELARRDLGVRRTPAAYALVLHAALAAAEPAAACQAAQGVLAFAAPGPAASPLSDQALAQRVLAGCGQRTSSTPVGGGARPTEPANPQR